MGKVNVGIKTLPLHVRVKLFMNPPTQLSAEEGVRQTSVCSNYNDMLSFF